MTKIIINADDLGLSTIVNRQISEFLSKGFITSSTILANNNTWDEVKEIIANNPQASFGLHLNLTQGKALSNNDILRKYGIVDDKNEFTRKIKATTDFPVELKRAILEEWSLQVEKLQSEGVCISHIDGHHHCHAILDLNDVLLDLLIRYNIKKVRNRYKYPALSIKSAVLDKMANILLCIGFKQFPYLGNRITSILNFEKYNTVLSTNKILTTSYFCQYDPFCRKLKVGGKHQDFGCIELMCHPGHTQFADETRHISDRLLQKLWDDIELISYNQL